MAREPFNRIWTETPDAPDQFKEPTDTMWDGGWRGGAAEDPPEAYAQNWWQNRVDFALQQIERYGVMDYEPEAIYGIGGQARGSDGLFYVSVTSPNSGNDPVSDGGDNWVRDFGTGQNVAIFDTSASINWSVPAILQVGLRKAYVVVSGAGGGGGGGGSSLGGSGGGEGGRSEGLFNLKGIASVSVDVGAGGSFGISADGSPGGPSSFGSYISCPGGLGGSGTGNIPTDFVTGVGGILNFSGQRGSRGITASNGQSIGGFGGGPGGGVNSEEGRDATFPGSGGGGNASSSPSGGNGADGIVIIRW